MNWVSWRFRCWGGGGGGGVKAIFHWAEFFALSDIFFRLKSNWRRVDVRREKKMSVHAENSALWKMAFRIGPSRQRLVDWTQK